MSKFHIFNQSFPKRCEVCHQTDCYDAVRNYCSRCSGITPTINTNIKTDKNKQFVYKISNLFKQNKWIAVSLSVLLSLIGTLLIFNHLVSKRRNNEISAKMNLHDLDYAMETYQSSCGEGDYPTNLSDFNTSGFFRNRMDNIIIDNSIIRAQTIPKSGYLFGRLNTSKKTETTKATYSITAYPSVKIGFFRDGDDCFYLDQSGIIRHSGSPTVMADANSPPVR